MATVGPPLASDQLMNRFYNNSACTVQYAGLAVNSSKFVHMAVVLLAGLCQTEIQIRAKRQQPASATAATAQAGEL